MGEVVAGERGEPAAEWCALEKVGEDLGGGEVAESVAAEDEVVAFAFDGNKIERKCLGRGGGGEAAVGVSGGDGVGGGEVSGSEGVVAADLVRRDAGLVEEAIEEGAGAGAGFAIDEADGGAG